MFLNLVFTPQGYTGEHDRRSTDIPIYMFICCLSLFVMCVFLFYTGWHRRINTIAGRADLPLYMLVPLLMNEAKDVEIAIRLVNNNQLTRIHRARYARVHARLFTAWEEYEDDLLTTTQLLRRCADIAGLQGTVSSDPIYEEDVE